MNDKWVIRSMALRTYEEVAEITGLSTNQLKHVETSARDKLRTRLLEDPVIREWVIENVGDFNGTHKRSTDPE